MYADQFATTGSSHRIGALFLQEMTHRVDACALARVYNAPRFTCDPFAYRAFLLTPG